MEDFQEFGFQNSRPKKRPLQPRPAWVNVMPSSAAAAGAVTAAVAAGGTGGGSTGEATRGTGNKVKAAMAAMASRSAPKSSNAARQSSSTSSSTASSASAPTVRQLPTPDGETIYAHIMQAMDEAMEEAEEEQQRRSRRIVPSDGRGVVEGGGGRGGGDPDAVTSLLSQTGASRATSMFGPIIVTGSRRVGDVRISDSQAGRDRLLQVFVEGKDGPNLANAASEAQKIMSRIKTKEAIEGNLDFSSCGLAKIPLDAAATILTYSTMKILNVTDNRIDSLPKTLPQSKFFGKLEELLASRNRLSRLPSTYHLFNHLRVIDISHNQFVTFPEALYEIRSLERVLASSNQIDQVDVEKLKSAPNLKEIDLEDNPIRPEILDKIESEIQFQILIRVSERTEPEWSDMD